MSEPSDSTGTLLVLVIVSALMTLGFIQAGWPWPFGLLAGLAFCHWFFTWGK